MKKNIYLYFTFLSLSLLIGFAVWYWIPSVSFYSILFFVLLAVFLFSFFFALACLCTRYDSIQQKIENYSQAFFEQCKNFFSQMKIDIEQETLFGVHYYDDIQRKCLILHTHLITIQDTLPKRHRKTWEHYLANIEEMEEYLEELKNHLFLSHLFETMRSEHPLWEHLHILPQSSKEIIAQSLVFLEDYFDILLLEIYPFLSKKKKKHYWQQVKKWQNESNF